MKASVVIPLWNMTEKTRGVSERCIKNFLEVDPDTELILIDNASSHPPRFSPGIRIRYIKWSENRGISPAWNYGARLAASNNIVFANSDVYPLKGWLEPCLKIVGRPRFAVSSPTTVRSEEEARKNRAKPEKLTPGISGGCFLMQKPMLDKIGPFDEQIVPACFEDIDMWIRLRSQRYNAAASSHSSMLHIMKASCGQASNYREMWARNKLFLEKKHRIKWKPGRGWMGAGEVLDERRVREHNNSGVG